MNAHFRKPIIVRSISSGFIKYFVIISFSYLCSTPLSPLFSSPLRYLIISPVCKGDWGTRLQENPQLILQLVIMIQLTSRRILRDQDKAPKRIFHIIYQVYIFCVRVSVIGAILVCLSITLVILEQAQVALEHHYTVQRQKQSCPLIQCLLVQCTIVKHFGDFSIFIFYHHCLVINSL